MMEDLGNPLEEKNIALLVLDSKEITDSVAMESVKNVRRIGQDQFEAFTIPPENVSLKDQISAAENNASKGKQQWHSSCDFTLDARLEMEILKISFTTRTRSVLQHPMMAVSSI